MIFKNKDGKELHATIHEGQPVFLGADVCGILGTNAKDIKKILDEDEHVDLGGYYPPSKTRVFVTEPGLYSLVLRSRKPEAKEFKRWVTHEVLPALRKTGGYVVALPDDTAEAIGQRAWLLPFAFLFPAPRNQPHVQLRGQRCPSDPA